MRDKTRSEIEKSIGNGKIKIILGPYSKRKSFFIENEVVKRLSDVFNIAPGFPKEYLFDFLKANIKVSKRRIFVIDRLTDYEHIAEIINMFEGNREIDLIASSNRFLEEFLQEDATLIRGRIQYIYFPPFSFEDFSEQATISNILEYIKSNNDDLFEGLNGFKYINEAKKICRSLIDFIGYPVSFRSLYVSSKVDVSPNTFINIFNYIAKCGLVHVVSRFNLEDNHLLPTTFYCYPTDPSFIYQNRDLNEKKWKNRVLESLIVYKAIKDARFVYKAIYRNSDSHRDNSLLHTFVVLERNKHYLLKVYLNNNVESLAKFCSQKYSLQKCVVVPEDIEASVDDNGVIFIGVSQYLKKGI